MPRFHKFSVSGYKAISIYDYDGVIKEKLYQFKGCYDYELKDIFLEYFHFYLKLHYCSYFVVPVPSFIEHDKMRGFNHVESIFSLFKRRMVKCIEKIDDVKQSDLNRNERSQIINHLRIKDNTNLKDKKILIVDDVYTTGSTIKGMIHLLEKLKPKKIKILVMSKTKNECLL